MTVHETNRGKPRRGSRHAALPAMVPPDSRNTSHRIIRMESSSVLDKYRVLSGSALKVIAVVLMLTDHSALTFLLGRNTVFLPLWGHTVTVYNLLRGIGRLAFPIFAFLVTEGYRHTHDRVRYGINLALFALLSEIPWNLWHNGTVFLLSSQNVYFTLLLGYLAICMMERYRTRVRRQAAWLVGLLIVSVILSADYGCSGYCFILFLYVLREHRLLRAVIGCGILSSRWKAGLAFIPIAMYNGERGFIRRKAAKYAFYLFYPLHILVLYFLKKAWVGY